MTEPGSPTEGATAEGAAEVRRTLEEGAGIPVESLPSFPDLERQDLAQTIGLKKTYATAILVGLAVQILLVDAALMLYGAKGVGWEFEPSVIYVWLGATVVEVVGVVLVVTRHLFPGRDH